MALVVDAQLGTVAVRPIVTVSVSRTFQALVYRLVAFTSRARIGSRLALTGDACLRSITKDAVIAI